jgi:hypothetical protein
VNKKTLFIVFGTGALSFGAAFVAGWLSKPASVKGATEIGPTTATGSTDALGAAKPSVLTPTAAPSDSRPGARAMTEQQLKELIYEVREKIKEYDAKLESLEKEKERVRIAQETLTRDIETLNNLRVDLAATVASVRSERDSLLKSRVEIERTEKANLVAIAAAYDRMDPASASEILTNMSMSQSRGAGSKRSSIDDAVKILYFMQERTKANVLAEMTTAEPALAALLCQRLKQVQEGK